MSGRLRWHYHDDIRIIYSECVIPRKIAVLCQTKMKYLHVAIIEDFEECLVSYTEEGLRTQVIVFLAKKSITPPTDEEWLVCILAEIEGDLTTDNLALGLITYYKTESRLEG